MKIKRFNENEINEISIERIDEITDDFNQMLYEFKEKNIKVEAYLNELNNYKDNSQKSNDQIDDSILALQIIKKDLVNTIDKVDTIINNLNDYSEDGRSYLYG